MTQTTRHLYHNVPIAIDTQPQPEQWTARQPRFVDRCTGTEGWRSRRAYRLWCWLLPAIIAEIVGPSGSVIGVELIPISRLDRKEPLAVPHVEVIEASGADYEPPPVDAILVNAGATRRGQPGCTRCGGRAIALSLDDWRQSKRSRQRLYDSGQT